VTHDLTLSHDARGSRPLGRRGVRVLAVAAAAALCVAAAVSPSHAAGGRAKPPAGQYLDTALHRFPHGADLEFRVTKKRQVVRLGMSCTPNAKTAPLIAASGAEWIDVIPTGASKIPLKRNGSFSYSGPAKVTDADGTKLTTTRVTVKAHYLPHGKTYHYSYGGYRHTMTMVFKGTVNAADCAASSPHKFYSYR
jgi:hypothetical protein